MSVIFIFSQITLWLLVIVLSISVIVLYKRPYPSHQDYLSNQTLGASDEGLPTGELFPKLSFPLIDGQNIDLQTMDKQGTVIFFTSTYCDICEKIYRVIKPIMDKHPEYEFLALMEGSIEEINTKKDKFQLSLPIYQLVEEDFEKLQVDFFPFAYFISSDGNITGKGLINNEHDINMLIQLGIQKNQESFIA